MKRMIVALGLLAAASLAACSDSDDSNDGGGSGADAPGMSAVGPGISIAEARDSDLDGPLLVNGFLVARVGEARLCGALLESFPPQCGGDSLIVKGVDLDLLAGQWELQEAQGVTWSDEPIQLLGTIDGDLLTVEERVSG